MDRLMRNMKIAEIEENYFDDFYANPFPSKDTKSRWSHQISGFPPRTGFAAVAVGNVIYSFGGINEKGHLTYSADGPLDVYVLNVDDKDKTEMKWKLLSIENNGFNPNQRHGHSAVAYKEFVVIFGGLDAKKSEYSNSTHRFNTQTLKWDKLKVSGSIPAARVDHSAVVIGNEMLVFVGRDCDFRVKNEVHSLNLDTFQWSAYGAKGAPPLCWLHSATVCNDKFMFIFGGYHAKKKKRMNELYCFNVNSKTWIHSKGCGRIPQGRQSHSAFVHNGLFFVFGGSVWFNFHLNDLFSYDPETREWKEVKPQGQPPSPRDQFGCVALDNRVFIFGGFNYKENYLEDTFVLEIE